MHITSSRRLTELLERKANLLATGEQLRELATSGGDPNSASVLDDFLDRFRRTRFLVLVVGDFKSGKSTLVNSLVGRRLCPVKATPRTAKVTRISATVEASGPEEVEISYLQDRPRQRVPLATTTLDDLVAVKGSLTGEVQLVDVYVNPLETLLRFPLRLVDTPGLGSIEEEHSAVTRDYVKHADVILFVISASKPLTEAERAFLLLNRPLIDRMVFVVNQIDRVAGEEAEVLEYVSDGLRREVLAADSPPPTLHAVSGLKGLEADNTDSGVPRLVEAIEQHLAEKPFRSLLKTICDQQLAVCTSLREQSALAKAALASASQSADALLPALETLRKDLRTMEREQSATQKKAAARVEHLHSHVPQLAAQLRAEVFEHVKKWVSSCPSEEECKKGLPAFLARGLTNAVQSIDLSFGAETETISRAAFSDLSMLFDRMEARARNVLTPAVPVGSGGFGRGAAALSGLSAFAEQMGGPQGGYGAATAAVQAALSPSTEVRLLSIGAALSLLIAALGGPVSWLFAGVTSFLATFFGWRHSSAWRERVVERVMEKLDSETLPSVTTALQESLANFATTLTEEISRRTSLVVRRLMAIVDEVSSDVQRGKVARDREQVRLAQRLELLDGVAARLATLVQAPETAQATTP